MAQVSSLCFLSEDEQIAHGVEWVARGLLRVGVALLGLRIAFGDIISGGWLGPVIIVIAMLATFLTGAFLARQLGLTMPFGWLSAGSVAVCGVSAAIAISSVLRKRDEADEELAVVVISVTALSTLAMIFYPVIASALAFSDVMAGMFIGGSIHDVAQVVGGRVLNFGSGWRYRDLYQIDASGLVAADRIHHWRNEPKCFQF